MGMGRWGAAEPNQTNMHIFNDGYIAAWWLKHALAKHRVKAILMWAHDCCYVGYGSSSSCPSSLWSMLILMVCMPSQLCKKVIHSFNVLSTKFLGQWSKCWSFAFFISFALTVALFLEVLWVAVDWKSLTKERLILVNSISNMCDSFSTTRCVTLRVWVGSQLGKATQCWHTCNFKISKSLNMSVC